MMFLPGIVLLPLLGGFLVPMIGLWRRRWTALFAILTLVGSAVCAGLGLCRTLQKGPLSYHLGGWAPPLGIEWVLDPLSAGMALLVAFLSAAVLIYASQSVPEEIPERTVPFYACALLFVAGLQGIVITGDLFNLYVFLELASLTAYALVAIGEKPAPVAAFRYLILGTIGASLYLLGVGHLYAATGSLNMADVAERLADSDPRTVRLSLGLIFVGLSIKMGLFPLHGWIPDAYTHAPSASSALLAGLMTKVGAYAMLRLGFWVYGLRLFGEGYTSLLALAGAAAVLAAAALAFAQKDLKRMLAYSSIGHVGYIALGLGLANPMALMGAYLHILFQAVMKSGLFLCLGVFFRGMGVRRLEDLPRLRGRMPWTKAAFVVGALSMIGIPPFCGFFSKWYLLLGAMQAGKPLYACIIVVSSLLSAAYFFRVIEGFSFVPVARSARDTWGAGGAAPAHPDVASGPGAAAPPGLHGPRSSAQGAHHAGTGRDPPAPMLVPILALAVLLVVFGLGSDWIRTTVVVPALPDIEVSQ